LPYEITVILFTQFTFAKKSLYLPVLSLIPILNGNFNKNYRLPFERLYGRRILENHEEESTDPKKNFPPQSDFEECTYNSAMGG